MAHDFPADTPSIARVETTGAGFLDAARPFVSDVGTQWSMGTFGAIAEFLHDTHEGAVAEAADNSISIATERGGLRLTEDPRARLVAYETVGRAAGTWRHGVAICLPEPACAMHRRHTVAEIGLDRDAIRPRDREGVLFDLGLSLLQTDACVRTSDPELIAALRASEGKSLFAPENPAMMAVLLAKPSPHRVFLSRVGRVEVYQPIPSPTGKSPIGPHTHILPKLLRAGRTHAATTPIPAGWVPCGVFYPAHAIFDAEGMARPFVRAHFDAFAALLSRYGNRDLVELQTRVVQAVCANREPDALPVPANRFARASVRVALRKLKASGETSAVLDRWITRHDRAADEDGEEEALHAC